MRLPNEHYLFGIMQFTEGYWREQIAEDIEKLLDHREDFCDEYDEAIMKAAACARLPDE